MPSCYVGMLREQMSVPGAVEDFSLGNSPGLMQAVPSPLENLRTQVALAHEIKVLCQCPGAVDEYRSCCQEALTAMNQAHAIVVPSEPAKPRDGDHPSVLDDYQRRRQRRADALARKRVPWDECIASLKLAEDVYLRARGYAFGRDLVRERVPERKGFAIEHTEKAGAKK